MWQRISVGIGYNRNGIGIGYNGDRERDRIVYDKDRKV